MRTIGAYLPVEDALPALRSALAGHGAAVLEAPPGAGKTTLVPLALLQEPWLSGKKILMLEPRRVATRAAAWRMAELLGEEVGETVGYAMRFERKLGRSSRIEVLTEGLFTRRLQHDPELKDVGLVIFDEFHERSLDADLGLTLCLDARNSLRPDLRLLVMSATLEGRELAGLLGDAPLVRSLGRSFPVVTHYRPDPGGGPPSAHWAGIVREALASHQGSVLVFLPGVAEIRRVAGMLQAAPEVDVFELHGGLDRDRQLQAIVLSASGKRKIVLATNIAETSLTIEDVAIVIDGGLERRVRYSPRTGMSRLVTGPISRASADQRRGRAGRTGPGICYRLWPEPEDRARVLHRPPEIMEADLAPLVLELAAWGVKDPNTLSWPTAPPEGALAAARSTLRQLGLFDQAGDLTPAGRGAAALPLHPRLAAMVRARPEPTSIVIAALLSGRDPWRNSHGSDVAGRVEAFARERPRDLVAIVRQLARAVGLGDTEPNHALTGEMLALAFPDRLARRRDKGERRYRLANGRGAELDQGDPMSGHEWLVIAELDDSGADARIRLAAAIEGDNVERSCAAQIDTMEVVAWDDRKDRVVAVTRTALGAITLRETRLAEPDSSALEAALLDGLRMRGTALAGSVDWPLPALPWTIEARQLRARILLARQVAPELPALDEESVLEAMRPYLAGLRTMEEVQALDLESIMAASLSYEMRRRLDIVAPATLATPAGTLAPVDYLQDPPIVSGKLQAFFGWRATPAILEGRMPLAVRLLSPAGRLLQVTADLEGFWRSTYAEVRKDMRGRYPKHPWPEDPLTSEATVRVKRRDRST